uniref:ATP synthase complex subunit 8 n=1 Tax=Trepobates sp. XD-2019 TaxID=2581071 RepID=A0A5B9XWP8_9HEMI|nr:ATPase subunit 8 [Trepobates sp. XD-2019]
MPQMAPISWTMLMMTFIMSMMVVNTIMYFNKNYITKSKTKKNDFKNMKWKW